MSRAPIVEPDGSYVVDDGVLPTGSTLGGPDLWLTLQADGTVAGIRSLHSGTPLVSSLGVRYWDLDTRVRLPVDRGFVVLRPESQEQRSRLGPQLELSQTVFVFDDGEAPVPAAYLIVRLRNGGSRDVHLAPVVFARIAAALTGDDVAARYDGERYALVVWNRSGPPAARAIALSRAPASWAVGDDHARAVDGLWRGPWAGTIEAAGSDPLASFQLDLPLAAGGEATFAVVCCALWDGPDAAADVLAACPPADDALRRTRARYEQALRSSQLLCPERAVELGVRWAKANMLRVMRSAPTGPGFTNDPGRSHACVGRDAAWFVHGCDWLVPSFSHALLEGFATRAEADGKIVEWYDLRNGETHDDGLDVNDDTPLFVLAVAHHVGAGGDRAALSQLYPAAARAGRQLEHRDERGLVFCSASGTGARGIVGWRNVIAGYRISGATTELNSEAYAALRQLAVLARGLGRGAEARTWDDAADALRAAIERHLRNPENGLYFLALDVDGRARSEVTCDLVFPVVFGVCDDATGARIVTRLRDRDFWTRAGLRTVPRDAPEYDPVAGSGLLGGVWVAVTFWYAFAAARFVPDVMAEALAASFAEYARDPTATNTVPGQFAEWLHGETLANHGMMLSPWFAPRYVWAAIEGAAGLHADLDRIEIAPNLASAWSWIAARNVPVHGRTASWAAFRVRGGLRVLSTFEAESPHELVLFDRDVSDELRLEGRDVAMVAFAASDAVTVFLGNRAEHSVDVALLREGPLRERTPRRRFEGLRGNWIEVDDRAAFAIAPRDFVVLEYR